MIKEVILPIITVCFLAPIVLGIVVTFVCLVINVFWIVIEYITIKFEKIRDKIGNSK